ncbi:MAG: flap endonuclease-1 [Candidatus Heimdallarchaeota archaeon]|nr:flap endonuclease-1 [Candidatus Heimdallarchaeota archaeon]MDH5644909.1 flap endonuclease-1 [Candidatus Heimdallarchaeota archaeon]
MGVKGLGDLINSVNVRQSIELVELKTRIIAFDAFNQLFQFLSSIRDSMGNSLSDEEGRVTSHLVGILTRNCNLLQHGVQPVYVFDGESHPLKSLEKQRRREQRDVAEEEYNKAIEEGDLVKAKKFAQRVNKLTPEILDDAKRLLSLMGIPVVQAPGEGEAQAAQLTQEGVVWATGSQDYDAILFNSPRMLRNLTITGKRNTAGGKIIDIKPELIDRDSFLRDLELSHAQLIDLGILMGSDFNPDGIEKIGPKTAYKLIKKYGSFDEIVKNDLRVKQANIPYEEIRDIFMYPKVKQNLSVNFDRKFSTDQIHDFLVNERMFDPNRYTNLLKKTERIIAENQEQSSLSDWF